MMEGRGGRGNWEAGGQGSLYVVWNEIHSGSQHTPRPRERKQTHTRPDRTEDMGISGLSRQQDDKNNPVPVQVREHGFVPENTKN